MRAQRWMLAACMLAQMWMHPKRNHIAHRHTQTARIEWKQEHAAEYVYKVFACILSFLVLAPIHYQAPFDAKFAQYYLRQFGIWLQRIPSFLGWHWAQNIIRICSSQTNMQ